MSNAVKKTISLPADLARHAEELARAEGKTLSGVIQDALRHATIERCLQELRGMQGYYYPKAEYRIWQTTLKVVVNRVKPTMKIVVLHLANMDSSMRG